MHFTAGNEAIDQKLHDIGSSGPVVLEPDYSKLKVVGLTRDVADVLRADEHHGLLCGTGWNGQAVSNDHQLASRRKGLEDRVRNHSAGAARTRREGLGASIRLWLRVDESASQSHLTLRSERLQHRG
ncbi:hypothetical protein ABIA28_006907 [Bradyrhizobium elkanii]